MASVASESNARRSRDAHKATRDAEKATITALMRTIAGRKWMWDILAEAQAFHPLPSDPQAMAIAEGTRRFGLKFLRAVTTLCPAEYIQMTTENTGVKLEDNPDDGHADTDPE